MSTSHEESGVGRGSEGRSGSEAPKFTLSTMSLTVAVALLLLSKVDLLMPLPPDLCGSKHAARATLVTEGGLTGAVSTTSRDTGNTGDGTTLCEF